MFSGVALLTDIGALGERFNFRLSQLLLNRPKRPPWADYCSRLTAPAVML
jgi:hypothetical protein